MQGTKKNTNNFLVQGSILAAASIFVRLIGLLYRIPMTRIIGNAGNGLYGYAFEIYNIALILSSYTLPIAVSKLVAARNSQKQYRNAYRIFLSAMCFAVVVGLVASLIIYFGADFFAMIVNDPLVAIPLKVLSPTIFVFAVMGVLRGFYQGKNTMIPTSVSQIVEQVVNAVVSIVAAYLLVKNFSASENVAAYGAAGGTFGTLIGALVGLLFLLFVFKIYKPLLNKQLRKDTSSYRESYSVTFKLLIITILPIILSQTVYQISGVLDGTLFGHIMASKKMSSFDQAVFKNSITSIYTQEVRRELMGIYSGKYRLLTNVPIAIASAIGAAIIPSIISARIKGMEAAIKDKVHAAIKFNMLIAIPSAVGMSVLASPILKLLFNDTDVLTANLLRIGSICIIFFALSTVTNAILQGINLLRIPVIHSAISLGIHVVLLFVLLQFTNLSTYALVIGNVTFALVVCILNWISVAKHLKYKQEIKKTFLIPTICAALMGVATYYTHYGLNALTGHNALATLVSLVVAVIVYFILLILMKGIEEQELEFIPKGKKIVRVLKKIHLL